MKKTLNDVAGVTLLEFLIALVILSVLAGLSAPSLSTVIPRQRLNGAAQKIAWDLRSARMLAIKKKNSVSVTFIDDYDYKIWHDRDNDGIEDGDEVTVKSIRDDYRGVRITASKNHTFYTLGTVASTPPGGQPITVTNVMGAKTIEVSLAGRVKLSS